MDTELEPRCAPATPGRCPVAHAAPTPGACPVRELAQEFDPFQDAYMAGPAEFLRWAREQAPIFHAPKLGYWVLSRYDTIKEIFRDPITFSPANVLQSFAKPSAEARQVLQRYGYALNRTLVNEDEPMHLDRRQALMQPFAPEHLAGHEPMVRDLVRGAVDRLIDDGRADLVDQLIWEVPFTVALHFLGIDAEDREKMRRFAIAHTVNALGRPSPEEQVSVAETVGQFWQFCGEVLEKMRRTADGPGWMRYSIRQQAIYPDVVTDSYLHSMMQAIIVAAHETTVFATTNAVRSLLEHESVWREVCADPALIPAAVEECLRYNGPVAGWRRRTTREVEVEGVRLPAGADLLLVVGSANHDPRRFEDPDSFDIGRSNASEHLNFGYGAHQCLGKNLGRVEMQIMIEELARRLPHMRLAGQTFDYLHNVSFRGPRHLWVEWDPAANPERQDRSILALRQPVRIGPPRARDMTRTLEVVGLERLSDEVLCLRLARPDRRPLPRWSAGSHIEIECGDPELARKYSLCGDPDAREEWRVAVRRDAEGRGGSRWIHERLQPGMTLRVRGPRNNFRLDEGAQRYLFLAGGIGITPIMTMAERARARGAEYALHYSARSRGSLVYAESLRERHGERLHLHVSDEGERNDFAALLAGTPAGTQIYACGPQRMLDVLERLVEARPDLSLRVEHFSGVVSLRDPSTERPFEVALRNSGLTLEVPADKTLLEVLRAHTIDVQSDCEEGLCGTCEIGVIEGAVDHRDSVLTRAERDENRRMMCCCSRAASGRLVLDL